MHLIGKLWSHDITFPPISRKAVDMILLVLYIFLPYIGFVHRGVRVPRPFPASNDQNSLKNVIGLFLHSEFRKVKDP